MKPSWFNLLFLVLGAMISGTVAAWPSEGKVVYYAPHTIGERCLVPAYLYSFDENASFSCDRFPQDKIFRFTEAIAGTKVELEFHGNSVTGKWYADIRNLGNEGVSEVVLDGKKFFQKSPFGGKLDDGTIVGTRKGRVIYAKANSEGHAPHLGYVRIELRELSDAIEWRQVQHLTQPVGYMPEGERLLLGLEGQVDNMTSLPIELIPCPQPGEMRAAPAAGCVPPTPAVQGTLRDKAAQRP